MRVGLTAMLAGAEEYEFNFSSSPDIWCDNFV